MPVAPINTAASGATAVVAAVAAKKIRVHSVQLWNGVATANTVKFQSGATDLHAVVPLPLAVGIPISLGERAGAPGDFLFETAAGQALNINLSAATAVAGWLEYSLE